MKAYRFSVKPIVGFFFFLLSFTPYSYAIGSAFNIEMNQNGGSKSLIIDNIQMVARITGMPQKDETLISPNNTGPDFDVYGTDLGLMWHMKGKCVGLFFGDTSGEGFVVNKNGGNGSNWRSNVLAFSSDVDLADGLQIDSMALDNTGKAREICAGAKANPKVYQTSIPTSAIRIGKTDCVHFMNIYDWGAPHGRWLTNYSSIYTSVDDGYSWNRCEEVTFNSDSHFSQIAYAKRKGWVYMLGTQAGRGDAAYLARFRERDLLDMRRYEYWNNEQHMWISGDENMATPILESPVGEASLLWHKKFKCWILTYNYDPNYDETPLTDKHAILYCTSKDLIHWSDPKVLVDAADYPALYCAYMHPLKDNDEKLWFIMSMWGPYNTFLMSADIKIE